MASNQCLLPARGMGNDATTAMGWREDASDAPLATRPLLALFFFALAIRCCGLLWGGVHPDENMSYPVRVLSGQLAFELHFYPPFFHYLHAIAFGAMFVVGRLLGVWSGVDAFKDQYFTAPAPFLAAARLTTAIAGALAAPIAAAIASRLGLGRRGSIAVGALMALLPVNVWLCHFAKNDVGMATATLLAAWAALRKLDEPDRRSSDLLFGLSSALMVSFKQSAVFLLGPLWVGLALTLGAAARRPWRTVLADALVWTGVAVIACVPMNLGILIRPSSFLDPQHVLGLIWVNSGGSWAGLVATLGGNLFGATPIGLALGLLAPLLVRRDARHRLLWGTTFAGLVAFLLVAGPTAAVHLLLPYSTLLYLLGSIAAVELVRRLDPMARAAGVAGLLALIGSAGWGTGEVIRQALATPVALRLATAIQRIAEPAGATRILAHRGTMVGLPIHPDANADDHARHQRLAAKYGIALHPATDERKSHLGWASESFYIRSFPWALGGLEKIRDDQLKTVTPYSWPVQQEEWDLDYWLDRGFTVFVIQNEEGWMSSDVPAYARLHRQIHDRGTPVARIDSSRPLFLEAPVTIYQFPSATGKARGTRRP